MTEELPFPLNWACTPFGWRPEPSWCCSAWLKALMESAKLPALLLSWCELTGICSAMLELIWLALAADWFNCAIDDPITGSCC